MASRLSLSVSETDGYRVQSVDRNCCWVALPEDLALRLEQSPNWTAFPAILRLLDVRYGSSLGCVCWGGDTTTSNTIHISAHLTAILELDEDPYVTLQVCHSVPRAEQVVMRCVSSEEYSLIVLEQQFFEDRLLSQGALVNRNQILPVWLRSQERPLHLMPLSIVPNAAFAQMTPDTELLIEPPPEYEPAAETMTKQDGNRVPREERHLMSEITEEGTIEEGSVGPSRPINDKSSAAPHLEGRRLTTGADWIHAAALVPQKRRKVSELRLQRPSEKERSLLEATVKLDTHCEQQLGFLLPLGAELVPMGSDTWFPEGLRISTAVSSVILMEPETAAGLGLGVKDYVWVSNRRFSESRISSDMPIMCVILCPSVAPGHCLMSEKSASVVEALYCSSVYVMPARPSAIDAGALDSILIQPLAASDPPSSPDPSQRATSDGEKGNRFLKRLLADELDVEAFKIESPTSMRDASQVLYWMQKAQAVMEYCSKRLPPRLERIIDAFPRFRLMEDEDEELTIRLLLFLRALILGWMEAQIEAIRNLHLKWAALSATQNGMTTSESYLQYLDTFGLPPCCFMHFVITYGCDKKASLELKLHYSREDSGPEEGVLIDSASLLRALKREECDLVLAPVVIRALKSPESIPQDFWSCQLPPWLEALAQKCIAYLKPALRVQNRGKGVPKGSIVGLMVSGHRESSKTSFVSGLCQKLAHDFDTMAHVYYISCRQFVQSLQSSHKSYTEARTKIFKQAFLAVQSAPSMIVLDDLDSWCAVGDEATAAIALSSTRAITLVREMMEQIRTAGVPVAFLATCTSVKEVDGSLFDAGFFDCHFEMSNLTTSIRAEMIKYLFQKNDIQLHPGALEGMDQWDAGFEFADLERLVSRTLHCYLPHQGDTHSYITHDDLQAALTDFKSAAQWKISKAQNHASTAEGLEDVGAMEEVKRVLRDCVEMPIKYPDLIKQCPLRLMSNALLYGPPGSGKTFVVNALSVSLDVRLISVKGPELFNKYVGQSEAAVRSTFRAASEAAPCILFFDEFEALGPHRGVGAASHSSDRVVNQLLTELDGVEGLNGVCVIAATSRPDLIDKALLRPGRLDRHIFCGLPDVAERCAILEVAAHRQKLDAAIDLSQIAQATDGYSGADLASIVSEAHLHAVGGFLKTQLEPDGGAPSEITISVQDFEFALRQSRPSSSEREKQLLEAIYSEFSGNRVHIAGSAVRNKGLELTFA